MNVLKFIGAFIACILLAIVVWMGGWKIAELNNNKSAHLRRTTFEQQATYRDEMVRKIQEVRAIDAQIAVAPEVAPQLKAQQQAVIDIVCKDNTHINGGLDNKTQQFVSENC